MSSNQNGQPSNTGGETDKKKIVNVTGTSEDTTSTRTRFWLTNDILAVVLVLSFIGLLAIAGRGIIDLGTIPMEMRIVYVSLVGAAGVWAFGETAFQRWRSNRGGDGGK